MTAFLSSLAGSFLLLQGAQAQTFDYTSRDLLLTFRNPGSSNASPTDLEINIGQASLYYGATPGSTITITQFNASDLSAAFADLNVLSWSISGTVPAAGDSGDAGVPVKTLWVTAPRENPSNSAPAWLRFSATSQGGAGAKINSSLANAKFYGSTQSSSSSNSTSLIQVPVGNGHESGSFLGSFGNYNGTFQGDIENTTPTNFDIAGLPSRSDFYELRPDSTGTQPQGKLLGLFQFNADGSLTFTAGPTLVTAPTDVLASTNAGSSAVFTVAATGGVLTYQWSQNGTTLSDDGSSIFGSQTSSLTVTNLTDSSAGAYSVAISDDGGTLTPSANLTIVHLPVIGSSPVSSTINYGDTSVFCVGASGIGVTYQWYRNGTALTDGAEIIGATNSCLTVTNAVSGDAGSYVVVSTDIAGSVTNDPVTLTEQTFNYASRDLLLTFRNPASTNAAPTDLEINIGQASLYYGATPGSTMTVAQLNAGELASVFDNLNALSWSVAGTVPAAGDSGDASVPKKTLWATSPRANATNVVTAWNRYSSTSQGGASAKINSALSNGKFYGSSQSPSPTNTSSVIAVPVGSGHEAGNFLGSFGDFTSTFQGDVENTTPTNFASAGLPSRSDLYELRPDSSGTFPAGKLLGRFELHADGTLTFTALAAPVVTTPTTDVSTAVSSASFSVGVSGDGLSYQWSHNAVALSDTGTTINGSQTSSLTLTNLSNASVGTYSVVVTNDAGSTSSSGVLTYQAPVLVLPPSSVTNTLPQGTIVSFSVSATGVLLSYQWSHNGAAVAGATTSSLSTTAQTTNEGTYSVIVSNLAGILSNSAVFSSSIIADTNKPTLVVTAPNTNILNHWTASTYLIQGRATDNKAGNVVLYSLNGGGLTNTTTITSGTNWSATVTLAVGTNVITIQSKDLAGNVSTAVTRTIVYVPVSPITLTIVGGGHLTTNWTGGTLDIGKSYTVTATPTAGNVFSNWTGTVSATTNRLVFTMVTNESLTATFIPNPYPAIAGRYNGLFYETNIMTHYSAGLFSAVLSNMTFSGTLKLEGKSVTIMGVFKTDGSFTGSFARTGASNVTVALQVVITNKQINGTISSYKNGTLWTAPLVSDLATFSGVNPAPTNYRGYSTFVIPGFTNPASGPIGYGYGTVNVTNNGTITLAGATADNAALSQSVPVSKDGYWPLYVSLYGGNGEVMGWLNFATTNNTPVGTVSWIKTGWTNAIFAGGFTNQADIIASQYLRPTNTTILDFNYGFGSLTLSNASGSFGMTNDVLLAYNNVVYTSDATTKAAFTLGSGLFKGSFFNPNTHLTNSFTGVVLQHQNVAAGAFVEPAQSGSVYLEQGF